MSKKNLFLMLFILLLFLTGCLFDRNEPEYVPGSVVGAIKDSVSLEALADYIYSFEDISIISITAYRYYSSLTQDSISTIQQAFESKSYIFPGTLNVDYNEDSSRIDIGFWVVEFREYDRREWASMIERFDLHHIPFGYQAGLFSVQVGKENDWISTFESSGYFKFATLNYVRHAAE